MESTFVTAGRLTSRQRQLVGELLGLFLAEGFSRLTLDDIAARLGCSKRTLYTLADSKEQLAVRTVRYFFKQSTEQVETAIAHARSPAARVTRYLEAVAAALRPASAQFLSDVDRQAATREVYEQNTHAVSIEPGTPLAKLYPGATVVKTNSIHHQAVKDLGRNLAVEAWSEPDRVVEAIRWTGPSYVFGVQWHPEFHPEGDRSFIDDRPILDDFLHQASLHKNASYAL